MQINNLLGAVPPFIRFLETIDSYLKIIMIGIIAILALLAIIFAIWVAFRLAKAEDEGKRKEAKQQLLWSIIAVVVTVIIFVLINTVLSTDYFGTGELAEDMELSADVQGNVNWVVWAVGRVTSSLISMGTIAAVGFAIYVGIKLATAQDESKRKEAKKQVMWTVIAILGAIILHTAISGIFTALSSNLG